jgi:hypothetical protein
LAKDKESFVSFEDDFLVIELLTAMTHSTTGAGHYYVDISAPAETLVLSRNEYV